MHPAFYIEFKLLTESAHMPQ